jgi:hypothetical protein
LILLPTCGIILPVDEVVPHFSPFLLDNQPLLWYNTHMEKRTQRTPQEIIAETEAKLARLQLKAAKAEAKTNPAVADLYTQLDTINKDIREAQKGLGSGPQSFDARVEKHQVWIGKIEDQRLEAEMLLESSEADKASVLSEIQKVISSLVTSKEMSVEA